MVAQAKRFLASPPRQPFFLAAGIYRPLVALRSPPLPSTSIDLTKSRYLKSVRVIVTSCPTRKSPSRWTGGAITNGLCKQARTVNLCELTWQV